MGRMDICTVHKATFYEIVKLVFMLSKVCARMNIHPSIQASSSFSRLLSIDTIKSIDFNNGILIQSKQGIATEKKSCSPIFLQSVGSSP